MLSTKQCKKILFNLGIKFGVSPRLISERLLSAQDKCDMLNGEISIASLEANLELWRDAGMPDYANGKTIPLKVTSKMESRNHQREQRKESMPLTYRAPFVPYADD